MVVGKEAKLTSFATALRWLAPWPLVAAVIILIVGYVRRKRPVAAPPAGANGAASSEAIQADLRSITTEPGE